MRADHRQAHRVDRQEDLAQPGAARLRGVGLKKLLTVLLFLPCIGFCGLFGASKVVSGGIAKEQKVLGEQFASKLEAGRAEHGVLPEKPQVPELFTYRPESDGGYVLYFAEPAFMLPTDFFYVWDRTAKRWTLTEASDLPR